MLLSPSEHPPETLLARGLVFHHLPSPPLSLLILLLSPSSSSSFLRPAQHSNINRLQLSRKGIKLEPKDIQPLQHRSLSQCAHILANACARVELLCGKELVVDFFAVGIAAYECGDFLGLEVGDAAVCVLISTRRGGKWLVKMLVGFVIFDAVEGGNKRRRKGSQGKWMRTGLG